MKRILWIAHLLFVSVGISQAQFTPLTLPVDNGQLNDLYLGDNSGTTPLYWSKSWDYGQNKIYAQNNVLSLGGPVPDSSMIAYIDTVDSRLPGHGYIASQMGIPFWKAGPDSTYFAFPGGTDTFPIASGSNGFFRLHHSLRYIYNPGGTRSARIKDISDTTLGRLARVRSHLYDELEGIVDPFLQPASNFGNDFGDGNPLPGTTLQGDPIPTVRWTLFSMMFEEDDTTIPFYWPGFATGDYSNPGTDGPHIAFNIWQVKGRFSNTVSVSLKWRGQQLICVVQDPYGNLMANPPILGPNAVSGFTDSLSSYANKWVDFLVRTKPGFTSLGDNPGVQVYFKESDSQVWNLLYEYQGDLLSEIENNALSLQGQFGIPVHYLGMGNGGIYPSVRLSGSILRNYWTPFRMAYPGRAFMKIRHSEYMFAEYGEGMEPNNATMFAYANTAMPPLNTAGPGSLPVEYLSFEAEAKANGVELSWVTASESGNEYFLVERSRNEQDWQAVQRVPGAGTSTQPLNYQVTDPQPGSGRIYYRIKQIDLNGNASFSPVRQVRLDKFLHSHLTAYPNPSKPGDILNIEVPIAHTSHPLQISVVDAKGASVYKGTIPAEQIIQDAGKLTLAPGLSPGLYILTLQRGTQRSFQKLMVY